MKKILLLLSLIPFYLQAETQQLAWEQLKPEVKTETVTLPSVNDSQKKLLAQVLQLQYQNDKPSQDEQKKIIDTLKSQGIDAKKALDARERFMASEQLKAETLNHKIDGKTVRMPGFIVPIEFDGLKGTDFLLVPYAGACIHLPPPPANQIVRISYPQGFEVENIQYPVWVEGKIKAEKQTEDVYLVDGKTKLTMGYKMEGDLIERYYE